MDYPELLIQIWLTYEICSLLNLSCDEGMVKVMVEMYWRTVGIINQKNFFLTKGLIPTTNNIISIPNSYSL